MIRRDADPSATQFFLTSCRAPFVPFFLHFSIPFLLSLFSFSFVSFRKNLLSRNSLFVLSLGGALAISLLGQFIRRSMEDTLFLRWFRRT